MTHCLSTNCVLTSSSQTTEISFSYWYKRKRYKMVGSSLQMQYSQILLKRMFFSDTNLDANNIVTRALISWSNTSSSITMALQCPQMSPLLGE